MKLRNWSCSEWPWERRGVGTRQAAHKFSFGQRIVYLNEHRRPGISTELRKSFPSESGPAWCPGMLLPMRRCVWDGCGSDILHRDGDGQLCRYELCGEVQLDTMLGWLSILRLCRRDLG